MVRRSNSIAEMNNNGNRDSIILEAQMPLNQQFFADNAPPRQRRETVAEMLALLLQNNNPAAPVITMFDKLRRVKYEDEKARLDYFECSI